MTRTLKWMAALALVALSTAPTLAAGLTPVGQWQVSTGEARYSVTVCGGALCAKLVWLRADARTSQNLALLNKYVVRGAQPAGASQWSGNLLFAGQAYDGTMTLVGRNTMTLKGCSGVLCKTFELTRI